ncbi:MAG TPA: hypothetical protein VK973_05375 [Arenicellales bacterium]|nr:hypothetical protein [Arenicellales bacterium]
MADVERLSRVLHRLVASGRAVVLVEHKLDVITEGDWVIDLGLDDGPGDLYSRWSRNSGQYRLIGPRKRAGVKQYEYPLVPATAR